MGGGTGEEVVRSWCCLLTSSRACRRILGVCVWGEVGGRRGEEEEEKEGRRGVGGVMLFIQIHVCLQNSCCIACAL